VVDGIVAPITPLGEDVVIAPIVVGDKKLPLKLDNCAMKVFTELIAPEDEY
jgi:hypothetical protein